ncbi:hypothetical protein [Bradyrhizobium sp. 174]|uniref:hypothetical protein n=1 Tax=Bradyrhizobium sp. 174 TaxID=2782645 RepID=UPI001FF7A9BC|nr:hypothetical protein [Bradyrhizobium sp. 174]MCK1577748.1 hypothetical protein [Bradyrhizobium sp. 174]
MSGYRVEFVGGPADGETIERPKASTVNVPTRGGGSMAYTMRRCRDAGGKVVEVLAPAGREIDRKWLVARALKN